MSGWTVKCNHTDEDGKEPDPPVALINPKIVDAAEEQRDFDGCLSFPGLYAETVRPHHLRVTGLGEGGKRFDRLFKGFDAVVVHHEVDHLDGVLFIDRVESLEDLYRVATDESGELIRVPVRTRSTWSHLALDVRPISAEICCADPAVS